MFLFSIDIQLFSDAHLHTTDLFQLPHSFQEEFDLSLPLSAIFPSQPNKASANQLHKQSDWRLGPIEILWFDFDSAEASAMNQQAASDEQSSPQTQQQTSQPLSHSAEAAHPRILASGVFVPCIEPALQTNSQNASQEESGSSSNLTVGILHLYRDRSEVEDLLALPRPTQSSPPQQTVPTNNNSLGTIVAILAVPHHVTPQNFLRLMGASRKSMSHLRIIRDSVPNRFLFLIKFRSQKSAVRFYSDFNGRPFSSFEPEVCHVVFVRSVKFKSSAIPPFAFPLNFGGELSTTGTATSSSGNRRPSMYNHLSALSSLSQQDPPHEIMPDSAATQEPASISSDNHQQLLELPTCPVCLERMDATVTGLLTIVCHHTFHCHCMMKWGDSTCPVCRYSSARTDPSGSSAQSAESDPQSSDANATQSECFECASTSNLWICLICGNIGCGRYAQAHAHKHYQETGHVYALELETQRVWDYVGDGYVHRVIQNKTDGKLVELPAPSTHVGASRFTDVGGMSASPVFGARSNAGQSASNTMLSSDGPLSTPSSSSDIFADGLGNHPRRILGLDVMDPASGITAQDAMMADKIDAIGLDYAHMLQKQLDTQRKHYENLLTKIEIMSAEHISILDTDLACVRAKLRDVTLDRDRLRETLSQHDRDRRSLEARLEKLSARVNVLTRTIQDDQAIHKGLEENYTKLKQDLEIRDQIIRDRDAQILELQEQARDLMFFLETQKRVEKDQVLGEDLRNASVVGVAEAPAPVTPNRRRNRRK